MKNKNRVLITASIGFAFALANYFGVTVPSELSGFVVDAICSLSEAC